MKNEFFSMTVAFYAMKVDMEKVTEVTSKVTLLRHLTDLSRC